MNDEEFVRSAITRSFPRADEPRLGLDIDRMVRDGRRESHTRTAGLATGGTVLAGAVALSTWGLVSLNQNGAAPGPGAGSPVQKSPGPQPSQSPDQSNLAASKSAAGERLKQSLSTPCTTTIDLESIVRAALPTGSTVSQSSGTSCTMVSRGYRSVDLNLRLAHPEGALQVQVESIDAPETAAPSGPAGAKAAAKESMAAANGVPLPTCTTVIHGWKACVSHPTKGGIQISAVALSSPAAAGGASSRMVNVVASGPQAGGATPLTDAALVAIAQDVATHTS